MEKLSFSFPLTLSLLLFFLSLSHIPISRVNALTVPSFLSETSGPVVTFCPACCLVLSIQDAIRPVRQGTRWLHALLSGSYTHSAVTGSRRCLLFSALSPCM